MLIQTATFKDLERLCKLDRHISKTELPDIISRKRVFVAEFNGQFIGWLRYNLFWDNTPFMNMLYILEEFRGKGYGKQIVTYWEEQMQVLKYNIVMTSTSSDEYSQHFYTKLGYQTVGGLTFQDDPFEIILTKKLPIIETEPTECE